MSETIRRFQAPDWLRRTYNKLDAPYWVIFGLYALLLIAAFILDSPRDIANGLWRILTSRSLLVTDYAELGGMGAMLVSSVIVGIFSVTTMIVGGIKPSGGVLMGIFLILVSYIIGWPAIAFFAWIAIRLKDPLWIAIGGPVIYGVSTLVFFWGVYMVGEHHLKYLWNRGKDLIFRRGRHDRQAEMPGANTTLEDKKE
jgi:hypothetical protein